MKAIKIPLLPTQTLLKLSVSLLALLFLWSLYHRFLFVDDGWLGEEANSLARYGVVKTQLFNLYHNQFGLNHISLYVYHKLFIWLGGLLIYFSGDFNPYLLKSISLVGYLALIALIVRDYKNRLPRKRISTSILLFYFLALPHLIWISFTYRPDVIVALFGYLSFRSISVEQGKKAFFLAGLFAGIAVLFHLNGLVFILAGMVYTALSYKDFKAVFRFGLGASICLLYFTDVVYHSAYATWWQQLKMDPGVFYSVFNRYANRLTYMLLLRIGNLFFRSIRELAYSIPGMLSLTLLLINRTTILRKGEDYLLTIRSAQALKDEVTYLLLLAISLYFFSKSAAFYNIYFYPLVIVLIAYAFSTALSRKNYQKYLAMGILFCNFLIAVRAYDTVIFKKNIDRNKVYATANRLIPEHSKVLAHASMVFNPKFEDYNISASYNARITDREMATNYRAKDAYRKKYITRFCLQNHFGYLVVDGKFMRNYRMKEIKNSHFQLIKCIRKRYWIYKVRA